MIVTVVPYVQFDSVKCDKQFNNFDFVFPIDTLLQLSVESVSIVNNGVLIGQPHGIYSNVLKQWSLVWHRDQEEIYLKTLIITTANHLSLSIYWTFKTYLRDIVFLYN